MSASKPNRVLANATAVIDLLARDGALSPGDIAAETGIARSSVYRLIDALISIRLVEPVADAASMVRLDRRWLRLADAAARGLTEWKGSQEVLADLARETGFTAYLTVLESDRAMCVAWAQGSGIDLMELRPGRSFPLNVGAAGRCFLAFDQPLADRLLASAEWQGYTGLTLVDPVLLREDAARNRDRGYVLSDGDVMIGVGALGVPLLRGGAMVGCLSVAGLDELVRENHQELAERVGKGVARLLA